MARLQEVRSVWYYRKKILADHMIYLTPENSGSFGLKKWGKAVTPSPNPIPM